MFWVSEVLNIMISLVKTLITPFKKLPPKKNSKFCL